MKEQIEEMKIDVFESIAWKELDDGVSALDIDSTTEHLRSKGYRKQEWISVEDKFPDVDKILGWDGTAMWFVDAKGICESLQNVISKNGITHWLPIPEPPRMKGENNEKI